MSLIIISIFFSCSQDDYENSEINNLEFEPYLNTFLEEANFRGYDYSNNNIQFYFADIITPNRVGLCYGNDRIVIDREYWYNASEIKKEFLIFHELGHCILNREHKNQKTNSGECLSYLKGSENNFDCSFNLHSSIWRKYYLDELFNHNTTLPNWYTDNRQYNISYNNNNEILSITNFNSDFFYTSFDFNEKEKFIIEFTFKDWRLASNNRNSVFNKIYFGQYRFRSAPLSETKIRIYGESNQKYFENNDYEFNNNIKLTIRKNNDLLQFFVDEQFIHAMEVEIFENNDLQASFDEIINMDIKVFEYD